MIWWQGGIAFAIWVGYGVAQSRRSSRILAQVRSIPVRKRGILGSTLFLVGAMVLIGGLAIVLDRGGFTRNGLTPLALFATTVLGLAFVHAQTLGMAMLVSVVQENVTNERAAASMSRTKGDQPQP